MSPGPAPDAPSADLLREFFSRSRAAARATRLLSREARVELELAGEGLAHFAFIGGEPEIRHGAADRTDFALHLPREAVLRLTALEDGEVGEIGVAFLALLLERDPALKVRVRLHAPVSRLVAHGYLSVLALGGLRVAVWLARNGFRDPRKALERLRRHRG
jgi:hypothetical protein